MAIGCRGLSVIHLLIWLSATGIPVINGHGRLVEPPSRGTAWRYGFATEKDYNDAETYCGGWSRQHLRNGGRCGPCGDAVDLPQPRPHEHGGRYGQGTIVRTYKTGSAVELAVDLTANHNGFFEFRLCPLNFDPNGETDDCFERYLLRRSDAEGFKSYPGSGSNIIFRYGYQLPAGLTCSQCVIQWRYVAGNNWGNCPNGTGMVGCGPQEEFRACADVRITVDGVDDNNNTITLTTTSKPRTRGTVTSRYTRPTTGGVAITTTTTTTTTEDPGVHHHHEESSNAVAVDSNPGAYVGVVISMATLLFAILVIGAVIFYFYRCHDKVKQCWTRIRPATSSNSGSFKEPLKLPASVFVLHNPPGLTGTDAVKPIPPPRAKLREIRQLSLTISEPLDVTINGVSVERDPAINRIPPGGEVDSSSA